MSDTVRFDSTQDWTADTRVLFFDVATNQPVATDGSLLTDTTLHRQDSALVPTGTPGEVSIPSDAAAGLYYALAYEPEDGLVTVNDESFYDWGIPIPLTWDGTSLTIVPPTQVSAGQVADNILISVGADDEPYAKIRRRSDLLIRNTDGEWVAYDSGDDADYRFDAEDAGDGEWSFGTCGELGISEPIKVKFYRVLDGAYLGSKDYDPVSGDASVNATAEVVASFNITPSQANSSNPRYSTNSKAPIAQGSAPTDVILVVDADGDPVDLSGKTVRLVFATVTSVGTDEFNAVDDTLAGSFKYQTGGNGITIGGDDDNQVTVTHDATKTGTAGDYRYFLWNVTDRVLLQKGDVEIEPTVFDV